MLLHSIVKNVSKPILGTVEPWLTPVRHAKQGLVIFVFQEVTENPSPYSRQCSIHCNESLFRRQLKWIRDRFLVIHSLQLDQGTIPRSGVKKLNCSGNRQVSNGELIRAVRAVTRVVSVVTATLSSSPVLVYNPYAFAVHDDPYTVYARLRDEAPAYWNPDLGLWVVRPTDGTKFQWSEKASIVGHGTHPGTAP